MKNKPKGRKIIYVGPILSKTRCFRDMRQSRILYEGEEDKLPQVTPKQSRDEE